MFNTFQGRGRKTFENCPSRRVSLGSAGAGKIISPVEVVCPKFPEGTVPDARVANLDGMLSRERLGVVLGCAACAFAEMPMQIIHDTTSDMNSGAVIQSVRFEPIGDGGIAAD